MRVQVTTHAWREWNADQPRQWSKGEIARLLRPKLNSLSVRRRRDKWQVEVVACGRKMAAVVTPELHGWTVVTAWKARAQ